MPQEVEKVDAVVNHEENTEMMQLAVGQDPARRCWLRGREAWDDCVHEWYFETAEPVIPSCDVQEVDEEDQEMVMLAVGEGSHEALLAYRQ